MPTYIGLVNWTEQGVRNLKKTTKRAKSFQVAAAKMKVNVREILWTMGRYDIVVVMDAPDDETITRLTLSLGATGNVKTETLKAFSSQEMARVLKGLP